MRNEKMQQAKIKAARYCAYQERTQQEVRNKLYELGLYQDEVEDVLTDLITENFINEERYAKALANGKFRLKKWGRNKIKYALHQKGISDYCIQQALNEISEEEYKSEISNMIDKKIKQEHGATYIIKNKIAKYMIGKGFESDLVWPILNEVLKT